ncbi:MAG TPA: NrfD/PsrC family molybdoenzyme membrane anchor subunit [Bryobacteraceae bacterium]|jgi:formate-dependent nitrite reductase membrane component NrfD
MTTHSDDGRNVDTAIATLGGEAAQQVVTGADERLERIAPAPWPEAPRIGGDDTTYYGRPLLKPPVWSIDIPIYYFLGGTAGAALTLGAALQLVYPRGSHPIRRLSGTCHWVGIIGSTAGAAFLIHDLGRPSRFLYMMRVFRPTSPMNMGTWILGGAAPTAIATGLLINRRGFPGLIGEIAGYMSGLFGAALAGYTGVLVSTTAIPVWYESRRWLPVLFMASSAAAAGSIIEIAAGDPRSRAVTCVFGTAGRVAELVAAKKVERSASAVPRCGAVFHKGAPAILWKTASALTAASLALSLFSGKSRKRAVAAGLLGAAGSLCLRFAIHSLGRASALDPRASFEQQRSQS